MKYETYYKQWQDSLIQRSYYDDWKEQSSRLRKEELVQRLEACVSLIKELWEKLSDQEKALWILSGRKPPCQ